MKSTFVVIVIFLGVNLVALNLIGGLQPAQAGTFPGPNGQIAFVSTRDGGNAEIYLMNSDGTAPTRLTTDPTGTPFVDGNPSWSPDGTKIAFWSSRAGGGIHIMNADGSSITKIADGREPSWSPDGTKIAFTSVIDGNDEIHVTNADGSSDTRLTNDAASDIKPSWSPDGTKIAFASGRVDDDTTTDTDIYVMNSDGSSVTRLNTDPTGNLGAIDSAPNWSPDGTRIAFQSNRDFVGSEIYSMKASDGTDLQRLTNNGSPDTEPSWSPDGTRIAFQSNRDFNFEIYSIKASDGTDITRLTNNLVSDTEPDWGIHGVDITPPTVTSTNPAGASTNVAITKVLIATFSEPMDGTTITASTFSLESSSAVSGIVSYNSADNSASFDPSSDLAYSTTYTAKISGAVKDAAGNSMGADYSWTFTTEVPPNQLPTADAGPDKTVNEGATVILDGTASSDADGNIASYLWEQTGGPTVLISGSDTATATFTAPDVTASTDLTFKLTVTDEDGAVDDDSVVVTVNNVNQVPTADAGDDFAVNEGTTGVQLDGTGSSDADGTIDSYLWEQTDGPSVTLGNSNTATATFDAPAVEEATALSFSLTITDNDGSAVSDTVVVTVNNVNQDPSADLAANPTTINEGETSALDASGSSDPDTLDSLTYSFVILNGGPGSITGQTDVNDPTATYEAPSDVSADQIVTIEVKVDDGKGGDDTATVDILVKDVPAPAQFTIEGFFAPVDMEDANGNPIVNTVKSGKSVALKFKVFDNNNVEQTSTSVIQSFKQTKISCGTLQGDPLDAIEITNNGGTELRYDANGGTFIQNWKTPSGQAGNCYSATVTTTDGSSITAYFKLR